jgi:hypothetical protein
MAYNPVAVNRAIESSNRAGKRIGRKEARAIHALLKGRSTSTMSTESFRDELGIAVTRFDRKQETRPHHNPYALGLYLIAADRAADAYSRGTNLIDSLYLVFNGALLIHLRNWFSDDARVAKRARMIAKRACVLCGQRIDDGKPCGCGARR